MKNGTRIFLIILITILLLGYVVGFAYCTFNKYASAEEIPENEQILNFNQLAKEYYNKNISLSSGENLIITDGYSLSGGHLFYIRYDFDINSSYAIEYDIVNTNNDYINVYTASGVNTHDFIFNNDSLNCKLTIYTNSNTSRNNIIIIDLTLMYGTNEPDLETCQNLFKAEYYSYSTGFPITLSGMAQYNNALNDVFQNYKFVLDRNALSTQTQATDLMGTLSGTITFAYNDENWYVQGAMYSPLFTLITAGSEFNIELQLYAPSGREERYICFGSYVDGELNEIYKTTHIGDGTTININFTTPVDIQTLYVYERNGSTQVIQPMNYIVGAFNIKVEQLDVAAAVMSSYSTGYNTALEYYTRGSRGFSEIFEQGRQSGLAESVGTITAMDYVRMAFVTIGEILMIEIFPNFTLGAFFLLPLITSAIFFIMRIAKGG